MIGGLGVNAYVEPVVSLDLDVIVASENVERVCDLLAPTFSIERFSHSINLSSSKSDLRIQLRTDPRYQKFLQNASKKEMLGYTMQVAAIEDIVQGKVWAYSDSSRRRSKRQKDLADLSRIVEAYPHLLDAIPLEIRRLIED